MESFFEEHYPYMDKLYFDYVNSEKYANNQIVKFTEPYFLKSLDIALEQIKQGDELKASDTLLENNASCERRGFILGFQFAINLIWENRLDILNAAKNEK